MRVTKEEMEGAYDVLLEAEPGGDRMPNWDELNADQRAKLEEACREAREIDPAADLIDVLYANIDWNQHQ